MGAVVLLGLNWLRIQVGGIHHLFSRAYWMERMAGTDLYNVKEAYLKRGSRLNKEVLLSFDDGPHPKSAPVILDILKREHVHAAFFVVGKMVAKRPDLVRRMIEEGHEVGNHTEDHYRLDTLNAKEIHNELAQCEHQVELATGHRMAIMRPPGMHVNKDVLAEAKAQGYTIVGWNIGAKDFVADMKITGMTSEESKALHASPKEVSDRVLEQAKNGVIVLLHDNPVTAAALPDIIDGLRKQGYGFATSAQFLSELPHPVTLVADPPISPALAHRL